MRRIAFLAAAGVLAGCGNAAPVRTEEETMARCKPRAQTCCPADSRAETPAKPVAKRSLEVEFLFLDLKVCERCQGTEEVLKEAVEEARRILGPTGVEVTLKSTHVTSEEQARKLGFVSSPTVRLLGRDAAFDVKESACSGCSTVGGSDVDCRVWTWQGREYPVPPKAMLLDAILRDAYLHPSGEREEPRPLREVPENLRRFFRGVGTRGSRPSGRPGRQGS